MPAVVQRTGSHAGAVCNECLDLNQRPWSGAWHPTHGSNDGLRLARRDAADHNTARHPAPAPWREEP